MTVLKVAAVQLRSGQDPRRNASDMERLVRDAAAQGARYVQTPEMTGALVRDKAGRDAAFTTQEKDIVVAAGRQLAKELGIHLHIGSTAIVRGDGKVANRAFLIGPEGDILATYDKIHMFDVDLDNGESWRESATYEPGRQAVLAKIGGISFGFAVCYDLRFPQLFRAEAMAGAAVLTVPAAFTRQTGEAHWHVLLRARAIENGAFVVAAAQGGLHEDGRETYGHSLVVDPWGRVIAELDHDRPGVIVAEIDTAEVAAARSKIPNLKNARDFTLGEGARTAALQGAAS